MSKVIEDALAALESTETVKLELDLNSAVMLYGRFKFATKMISRMNNIVNENPQKYFRFTKQELLTLQSAEAELTLRVQDVFAYIDSEDGFINRNADFLHNGLEAVLAIIQRELNL